jgi:hypothetical protein
MKGDFSRFTFDPAKRYTKVLKQQGRVDVDADWNELNDILDGLDRKTRVDVIGECGAPIAGPGFGIALDASKKDLTVSAGRFYSHGILVELPENTTYLTQPHLPAPPALAPADGRVDAVFLDVWERHVTAIEDPSIREVALGGPDTTTRVQTVFQVRITQNAGAAGAVTCDTAAFPDPSGDRMLASFVPAPPSDDLCAIAPGGGFRGLENRLYRVEVHDSGGPGSATFKWSRDNGSVVFAVTEFPALQPTKVRVSRLGRDQVLTFRFGDWVEVLGDQSELAGAPGTLAEIVGIDEAARELTLSKDVSKHAAEAHPKVRRWDQPSDAVPIGPGPFVLEDGLQVEFSGATLRTGDYWTIPARTAAGPIQFPSTPQPPEGIEHFYCPLALVTWHVSAATVTGADITDCRPKFPPLTKIRSCCCCTVTVGSGGDHPTIQAAVGALAGVVGPVRICLRPGTHDVTTTVLIHRGDITLEGCGPNARVVGRKADPVFRVAPADGGTVSRVTFERLWMEGGGGTLIQASRVAGLRIEGCHLETTGPVAAQLQATGLEILENTVRGAGLHITDGSSDVVVRENDVADGRGAGIALGGIVEAIGAAPEASGVVAVRIVGNLLSGMANSGVATVLDGGDGTATGDIEDVTIAGNRIVGCARQAAARPFQAEAVGGIVLENSRQVRVRENQIVANGFADRVPACGVFFKSCFAVEVDDNQIEGNGTFGAAGQRQCIEFGRMRPGRVENPFVHAGVTFQVFDHAGLPPPANAIRSDGGLVGLSLNFAATITLPGPASSVELELFTAGGRGVVREARALDARGRVVDSKTMSPNQRQRLSLEGAGIVSVTIGVPQDETNLLELCFTPEEQLVTGTQNGIVATSVFAETLALDGARSVRRGGTAMVVRGNSVVCPAGRSLSMSGAGAMLVEGNSFVSTGVTAKTLTASSIRITNVGRSYHMAVGLSSFKQMIATSALGGPEVGQVEKVEGFLDGRVLFHDNQVAYKPRRPSPMPVSLPCMLATFDDVSVEGNEFVAEEPRSPVAERSGILVHVTALGFTARVIGNRLSEAPRTANASGLTVGQQAIASLNQATHCLVTLGLQRIETGNQVAIADNCSAVARLLEAFVNDAGPGDDEMRALSADLAARSGRLRAIAERLAATLGPEHPRVKGLRESSEVSARLAEDLRKTAEGLAAAGESKPGGPEPGFTLAGRLVDATGAVVPGHHVRLSDRADTLEIPGAGVSDARGEFSFVVPAEVVARGVELFVIVEDSSGRVVHVSPTPVELKPGVVTRIDVGLSTTSPVKARPKRPPAPPKRRPRKGGPG